MSDRDTEYGVAEPEKPNEGGVYLPLKILMDPQGYMATPVRESLGPKTGYSDSARVYMDKIRASFPSKAPKPPNTHTVDNPRPNSINSGGWQGCRAQNPHNKHPSYCHLTLNHDGDHLTPGGARWANTTHQRAPAKGTMLYGMHSGRIGNRWVIDSALHHNATFNEDSDKHDKFVVLTQIERGRTFQVGVLNCNYKILQEWGYHNLAEALDCFRNKI